MLVLLLLLLVGLWEDVFTGGCGLTTLSFSSSMSPSSSTLAPPPLLTSASSSPPSFCCLNVSTCLILRLSSRTRSISTKSSCTCSMLAINSTYVHINDQHMWWMVSRETLKDSCIWSGFYYKRLFEDRYSAVGVSDSISYFPCVSIRCFHGFEMYTETLPWGKTVRIIPLLVWNH